MSSRASRCWRTASTSQRRRAPECAWSRNRRLMEDNKMDRAKPSSVVTGAIKVAQRDREALVKVLQAHVPRVREKDGCIAYAFAVDVVDPNVLHMSEAWR